MVQAPAVLQTADGFVTTERHGYAPMAELLAEYEAAAQAAGAPTSLLRPGLHRSDIQRQLKQVDIDAPDEIVAWFKWHDGQNYDSQEPWTSHPVSFFNPASLTDSIARYRINRDDNFRYANAGITSWAWAPGHLSLGREPTDLVADLRGVPAAPVPLIRPTEEFGLDEVPRDRPIMLSMCTMVTLHLGAIQVGYLHWNGHGWRVSRDVKYEWSHLFRGGA